jgi:hypothetical protein
MQGAFFCATASALDSARKIVNNLMTMTPGIMAD